MFSLCTYAKQVIQPLILHFGLGCEPEFQHLSHVRLRIFWTSRLDLDDILPSSLFPFPMTSDSSPGRDSGLFPALSSYPFIYPIYHHPGRPASPEKSRSPSPSAPQNSLTLRALVSTKDAGIIIGKAGKNVADLRDQTGVKAGVSKVIPGVHERVLTVTGSVEGVAKVHPLHFFTQTYPAHSIRHILSLFPN